jgi:hypothetical protein
MYQNGNFKSGLDKNNEIVFENTVEGRIIPVRDGEAMVFEILLDPFKIVCIANIPEDGKTTAPVYLKYKMNDGRNYGGFRKRLPRDTNDKYNRDKVPVEYVNGSNADGGEVEDAG